MIIRRVVAAARRGAAHGIPAGGGRDAGRSKPAGEDRHLRAAQPVRRRVRAGARRLRRAGQRRAADRGGGQRHAVVARSAFRLHERQALRRDEGADARRLRRPRHRGDDGGRPGEGGLADRRYAGVQGRHRAGRPDHPHRRRAGAGHDPARRRREDARPGRQRHQADHPPRRSRAVRRHPHPLGDQDQVGALAAGRQGRLHPHQLVQRADRRRAAGGDRRPEEAGRTASCRASSSTCATTRAAC